MAAAVAEKKKLMRDLTVDEFVRLVLESDPDLEKKVKMNEIDAKDVLARIKPSKDKYGIETGISFGKARIREAILKKSSFQIKGIAAGQRDRYGTNTPVRIPIIRSNAEHKEVVLWGTSVAVGDSKVELTFPSIITFNVIDEKSDKYESIRVVDAESYTPLPAADAVEKLSLVATSVGDLSPNDELGVVVVRGKISFIRPAPKFQNREKVGDWPLYLDNQRDHPQKHPVLQVTLASENNQQARVVFERQRNATPAIYVSDLDMLCSDAVALDGDPNTQARIVGQGMKDREVIVVGFVTKVSNYEGMTYYDLGGYGIYDAVVERQATLEETPSRAVSSQDEPAEVKTPKKTSKKSKKDDAKDVILKFVQITGAKGDSLTAEFLKANLSPLNDITPSVIEAAIDELRDEGEI